MTFHVAKARNWTRKTTLAVHMYECAIAYLGTWRTRNKEPSTDVSANVLTGAFMTAKMRNRRTTTPLYNSEVPKHFASAHSWAK